MAYPTYYNPFTQPTQYQQIPQPAMQSSYSNNSGIIWVQGESGAKSYLVAPNNTVALWDSESETIYLKSADASGMPSIKTLDYKIRENSTQVSTLMNNSNYATNEEVDKLRNDLETLKDRIDDIMNRNKEGRKRNEQSNLPTNASK